MKAVASDETCRGHVLVKTLGIMALGFLMLVSIVGGAPFAYITNLDNTVSVIDTATDTVIDTICVGKEPFGVAVTPDGTKVYVTNFGNSTVSVIDTATNKISATLPMGYVGR